jgi:uncharacterized protein YndB with AHSA1/START domain/ADP-ribose pyrophosphatase YjhB (NUDIX family)
MTPIIKKISISAPASKVWEALTNSTKLSQWITMPNDINPAIGNEFTFEAESRDEWGDWDRKIRCRITELIPNKKIVYTWASELIKGETLVSFELVESKGQTELTLTHSGWENLSESQEMWRERYAKGWRDLLSRLNLMLSEDKAIKPVADVAVFSGSKTLLVKYKEVNKYDHQKGWFIPDDLMIHAEHPDDAAVRILNEQLGVEDVTPKLAFIESFIGGDKSWHLIFHYYITVDSNVYINPSGEIAEMKWFETNAMPDNKEIAHHGWAKYTINEILSKIT